MVSLKRPYEARYSDGYMLTKRGRWLRSEEGEAEQAPLHIGGQDLPALSRSVGSSILVAPVGTCTARMPWISIGNAVNVDLDGDE